MAWLSGWTHRKKITIDNSFGSSLTNYQSQLIIDTESLIDSGQMLSDGDDIRITNSDGTTLLEHWVEEGTINTVNTSIWFKVPSISANTIQYAYIYYGNSGASNVEDGASVFEDFDDFNNGSIDAQWTQENNSGSNSISESARSGYVRLKTTNDNKDWWTTLTAPAIDLAPSISDNFEMITAFDCDPKPDANYNQVGCGVVNSSDDSNGIKFVREYASASRMTVVDIGGSSLGTEVVPTYLNVMMKIRKVGTTYSFFYKLNPHDEWFQDASTTKTISNLRLRLFEGTANAGDTQTGDFNYFYVKKYSSNEPVISLTDEKFGDNFNDDSLDINKWTKVTSGTASLLEQNQRIEASLSGAGGANEILLKSNKNLIGNFDIQIDFSDLVLPDVAIALARGLFFKIDGDNFIYVDRRYYGTDQRLYGKIKIKGVEYITDISNSSTSGKYRVTRKENTATIYYWNGSSWTQFNQRTDFPTDDGDIRIANMYTNNSATASCNFDNFIINEGVLGYERNDDFDDNSFDTTKWTKSAGGDGDTADIIEQNQRLEMSLASLAQHSYLQVTSEIVKGDFDVEVDWNFSPGATTRPELWLQFWIDSNNYFSLLRLYEGAQNVKAFGYANGEQIVNTVTGSAVTSGIFRLQRVGKQIALYYDIGSGWVEMFTYGGFPESNGAFVLKLVSADNFPDASCYFDNFKSTIETPQFIESESIHLIETTIIRPSLEKAILADTVTISDAITANVLQEAPYLTKLIHMNSPYLLMVSDTDPVKLTKVDITDPNNPSWTVYGFNGSAETYKNAKDLCVNDTYSRIYIACADGIIADVNLNDLNDRTEIDTGDANNLTTIENLDVWKHIYTGTDDVNGEVIMLDDSIVEKLNSDFRFLVQTEDILNTNLSTIFATQINSDFRFLVDIDSKLNSDFRFLKYSYNNIPLNAIARTDFHVYIDSVELTDVDLATIRVMFTADEVAQAVFTLGRRHDKPDYTIDGTPSEITNQNTVQIYIQSQLIFEGKIRELNALGSAEKIEITAQTDTESEWAMNHATLPLTSISSQRHLYDIVLDDINIYNPNIEETRQVITGSNGKYWNGSNWVNNIEDAIKYTTFASAQSTINAIPSTNTVFHNVDPYVTNYDENPETYLGVIVKLGKTTEEMVARGGSYQSRADLAEEVSNGEWKPKQNYTYFWRAAGYKFISNASFSMRYIGTNPSSLTSDLIYITGLSYNWQREYNTLETDNGQYVVGSPPYQEIITKNGRYIAKWRYSDRVDGLYSELSAWYNYLDFAQEVADIEYNKLTNINGDVLPITRATISLTIDAYLFYNIKILTRINLDNTTESNIYKDNNGFPVATKQIEINSGSMTVTLQTDNQFSRREMNDLDDSFPDENDPDYYQDAYTFLRASKFDPSRLENVQ